MRIGVFSVISWTFLDQRPQVFAKKFAEWGHEVVYIEPFNKFKAWQSDFDHPWKEYESHCWSLRFIQPNIKATMLLQISAHNRVRELFYKNDEYRERNINYLKSLNLDLAIVIEPHWGEILDSLEIPYIYDHVDDTHHMGHVEKELWYNNQVYCEKHSIAPLHIQPNIARRHGGIYVPNGIDVFQLNFPHATTKDFDAGCLSAIADWFDIESVLKSKKKILLIGPMELSIKNAYFEYRKQGGTNVTWIPRVSRTVGSHWLTRCKTAIIPFKDDHGIVDYVMPLKLVEYLYLGLPSISYLNKGIEEEFEQHVSFYSSLGWLGLPNLDEAIEQSIATPPPQDKLHSLAKKFTWDNVFIPLRNLIEDISRTDLSYDNISSTAQQFKRNYEVQLVSKSYEK